MLRSLIDFPTSVYFTFCSYILKCICLSPTFHAVILDINNSANVKGTAKIEIIIEMGICENHVGIMSED